jgi:hypothetical protein
MKTREMARVSGLVLGPSLCIVLCTVFCAGCGRAPSFDIVGSYFPAWLLCICAGLLLTVAARWLFLGLHVVIVLPVLTYPSLSALFTFALWLALFR